MSRQVSELTGPLLALWTALAAGLESPSLEFDICRVGSKYYAPHEDATQAFDLLEGRRIDLVSQVDPVGYQAEILAGPDEYDVYWWRIAHGETALIAICRAVVMAKFGDTVPDEVLA